MHPAPPARAALLEPTLATSAQSAPLLSPRATFMTSFFGGPCAALVVGTINLVRLRRARRDAWLIAAAALFALVALALTAAGAGWPELLDSVLPKVVGRRLNNLLGVAAWGISYLRLRPEYRAVELTGDFAKPWVACLAALAGALLLHLAAGFAGIVVSSALPLGAQP
jgi:hypothetical protein